MEGRRCGLSGCAEFGVSPDTQVEGWKVHSGVTSNRLPSHHSIVMRDSCGSCEPCGRQERVEQGHQTQREKRLPHTRSSVISVPCNYEALLVSPRPAADPSPRLRAAAMLESRFGEVDGLGPGLN